MFWGIFACMKGMVAFVESFFDRVVEREAFGLIESMQRQIAQLYAKLDRPNAIYSTLYPPMKDGG